MRWSRRFVTDAVEIALDAGRVITASASRERAVVALRQAATERPDWNSLIAAWNAAGMTQLACKAILDHASAELDARSRERLAGERLAMSATALAATRQLVEIVAALEALGIQVMPYKGPMLALDAYGDPALRLFNDLDILVAPTDVDRAW